MPNPYVNTMTRLEMLVELADYQDDDGLNHVVTPDHEDIPDLTVLSDVELRDLLKRARATALLWEGLGE